MSICTRSSAVRAEARARGLPPALVSLLLQAGCVPTGLALDALLPPALGCALLAAAGSIALTLPPWWVGINALFIPALTLALAADLPPALWLWAFLALLLVYWSIVQSRAPLFPSSRSAAQALAGLLAGDARLRFADLGCGSGSLLLWLVQRLPALDAVGVEHAPLPWLLARWRTAGLRQRCRVLRGSLWRLDLGGFDVVYAYLSPQPMAALWQKACREMTPGSLLVSNTFAIPGATAEREIVLDGGAGGVLYLYRPGVGP